MTEEERKLIEVLRNQPVGAAENAEAVAKALVAWIESVEERHGEDGHGQQDRQEGGQERAAGDRTRVDLPGQRDRAGREEELQGELKGLDGSAMGLRH